MIDLTTAMQAFMQAAIDMGKAFADILTDFLNSIDRRTMRRVIRMYKQLEAREEVRNSTASGRVRHLALYAKKRRVRNKNLNRIRREKK